MYQIDFYSDDAAELVWLFVDANFDTFCDANITEDVSMMEFAERHFSDFQDFAIKHDYQVIR